MWRRVSHGAAETRTVRPQLTSACDHVIDTVPTTRFVSHGRTLVLVSTALTGVLGCRPPPSRIADALASGNWQSIRWYQGLDFTQLTPGRQTDFWQLREGVFDTQISKTLAESRNVSRMEIPAHRLASLDTVTTPLGFASWCMLSCELFLVTLEDGEIQVISSLPDLKDFLRPIDSVTEAVLIGIANGYWSGPELINGAARQGADGFDLIMLKTIGTCKPVQVERVLLRVEPQGDVVRVASENERFEEDGCIMP